MRLTIDPTEMIPIEELENYGFGNDDIKMLPANAIVRFGGQKYVRRSYLEELGYIV